MKKANIKPAAQVTREIRCIMFADVSGFSKLSGETQVRLFYEEVIKPVVNLLSAFSEQIIEYNTWGDGIFIVFDTADVGCRFALKLRDLFRTDFQSRGLSDSINIRCALHLGEIVVYKNAMPDGGDFLVGNEITLAARIEPIVRPGEVWATEAVAANNTAGSDKEIVFDELGVAELAKRYGSIRVFGVRRPGDAKLDVLQYKESSDDMSNDEILATLGTLYSDLINRVDSPDMRRIIMQFYSAAIELSRPV